MPPPYSLDLARLAASYADGTLTPSTVVRDVYAWIAAVRENPIWIHLLPQDAVAARARALEGRRAGVAALPLYGVPFAVKDNIDVAGHPTTAACAAFSYRPEVTAHAVRRLEDAGALLIGKTNLDQFATGLVGTRSPYGACRNAFNPAYIAGGGSLRNCCSGTVSQRRLAGGNHPDRTGVPRRRAGRHRRTGPSCGRRTARSHRIRSAFVEARITARMAQ